jgi:hypothetical protein
MQPLCSNTQEDFKLWKEKIEREIIASQRKFVMSRADYRLSYQLSKIFGDVVFYGHDVRIRNTKGVEVGNVDSLFFGTGEHAKTHFLLHRNCHPIGRDETIIQYQENNKDVKIVQCFFAEYDEYENGNERESLIATLRSNGIYVLNDDLTLLPPDKE